MPEVKAEYENALHKHLKDVKGAQADKMFGYPVYKANDTMAVSVVKNGIIARVGEQRAKELIGKGGVKAYEPQPGRVWKDWVLLTGDFDKHKDVLKQAVENTAKLPKAKKASAAPKKAAAKTVKPAAKSAPKSAPKKSTPAKAVEKPKKRAGRK